MDSHQHPSDDHTHHDTVRERQVIVTNSGGDRGPGSMLVAVVAIVVIVVLGWFAIQALSSTDVTDGLDVPSEVDVNINDDTGGDTGSDG